MDIDIHKLINFFKKTILEIILYALIILILVTFYISNIPNKYRSEVTLVPVGTSQTSKFNSSIGGLAALAGINLNASSIDKTSLAIEIIKSKDFVNYIAEKYKIKPEIFAGIAWDKKLDKILFDEKVYIENESRWLGNESVLNNEEPDSNKIYKKFMQYINISREKETGIVRIQFDYYSPSFSKKILNVIIDEINFQMKAREIDEAESSISYLLKEYENTKNSELKNLLISLVSEQKQRIMLANVKNDFVFQTIDSAKVNYESVYPNRLVMVIVSGILAIVIGSFLAFIRKLILK